MDWAVYRAFVHTDNRYYDLIRPKISFLRTRDLPDLDHVYFRKKPFDVKKPPLWG